MNKHDKERDFFNRMLKTTIGASIQRLIKFDNADMPLLLIGEVLLLLDKLNTRYPEEFGEASKNYRLENLKNRRGFCGNFDCFNVLSSPSEWPDDGDITCFLQYNCMACARRNADDCAAEDEREALEAQDCTAIDDDAWTASSTADIDKQRNN